MTSPTNPVTVPMAMGGPPTLASATPLAPEGPLT